MTGTIPPRQYLAHAQLYERHGLRVFPVARPVTGDDGKLQCSCQWGAACNAPGKHPREAGWRDAPVSIMRWWGLGGLWNIGIETGAVSGIVVLDVDPRNGGDETLAKLEDRHGVLPDSWRFLTGGGGEDIIFRHPGGYIKSRAGALGRGLDIKAEGGFIVAPPSLHISGGRYAIDSHHHLDHMPLAPLPDWLRGALMPPPAPLYVADLGERVSNAYVEAAVREATHQIAYAVEGERNATLNREAYSLARFIRSDKISERELAYQLAYAAASAGLSEREIASTIRNAFRSRK